MFSKTKFQERNIIIHIIAIITNKRDESLFILTKHNFAIFFQFTACCTLWVQSKVCSKRKNPVNLYTCWFLFLIWQSWGEGRYIHVYLSEKIFSLSYLLIQCCFRSFWLGLLNMFYISFAITLLWFYFFILACNFYFIECFICTFI